MPYSQSPENNIGVVLKRKFKIDTEVKPDGTVYLFVNMNCGFESIYTIYDLICQGRDDIIGLDVNCDWQSFDKSYHLEKIYNIPISQPVDGFNLLNYWTETAPWHLKGIDTMQSAVSVYNQSENRNELYIPQSLRPVVTWSYIAKRDKNLSKEVFRYTKLSMKKRLQSIQEFLAVLNNEKSIIDINPVSVEELGYHQFDCTKNTPNLLIAQGRKITLQKKYDAFRYGFYKMPDKEIIATYMSYEEEHKKSYDIVKSIAEFCVKDLINEQSNNSAILKLLPLSFCNKYFSYKKGDSFSYEKIANEIKKISKINFVISVVPIEKDEEEYYEESTSPYDVFKKVFARLELPSQMISIEMADKLGTSDVVFSLQNIALGILSKSGGIPWILEKPMDGVDCFIGLDVATKEKGIHYPACSVCLSGQGNLLKYYTTSIAQKGEKIDTSTLENIFNNILLTYEESNGHLPKHIVIHRDGFSNENIDWYIEYFEKKNIKFDLIEVKKFVSRRLMDISRNGYNLEFNPAVGTAVIKENEAYLVTTNVKASYGSPQPIHLVHRYGNLSMESIAKQIYVLSEMHTGSMRTSRLPLTTLYADKICKNHDYVPINKLMSELYFL